MVEKFQDIINKDTPTLVDFSAEWCGPCKMMKPILTELKNTVGEDVRIIKIDVDRNPQVANAYDIQSVPTLMVFQSGQVKWRKSGVVPAAMLANVLKGFA